MAHHARVEELSTDSDSDPDIMDVATLPSRPAGGASNPSIISPANIPMSQSQQVAQARPDHTWCMLYPIYFDAAASHAQGRRVSTKDAVKNPLAKTMCDACVGLGAQIGFEPGKRHPKDWANPGRVRIKCWDENGKWILRSVKNKRMMYKFVAEYLKKHPTTPQDPFKLPIRGMPMPTESDMEPPPVPRGWRINEIIPLHSPAMSGGGVSDNIMKDIQAVMRGEEPGTPSTKAESSGKKSKKKGKK